MSLVCLLIVSLMQCSLEPSHTGPFSQQLNLVLSLITILVVLVCGRKASLVLVQLCGHALRRTSWRGNIRSTHAKLKLLADMVLLFATMDNQQWLLSQPKSAQDVVLLLSTCSAHNVALWLAISKGWLGMSTLCTLYPKQTYECPHCNKSFASKSPLTVHLNNCDLRPEPAAPAGPRQRDARLDVARPFPCSHDGCDLRFSQCFTKKPP